MLFIDSCWSKTLLIIGCTFVAWSGVNAIKMYHTNLEYTLMPCIKHNVLRGGLLLVGPWWSSRPSWNYRTERHRGSSWSERRAWDAGTSWTCGVYRFLFSLSAPPVASNSKVYFSICINVLLIRAHQENRDQQDKLERKDPQDQLAFLVLMDLVVIRVLM